MKLSVDNAQITISDPTPEMVELLESSLVYVDKAKQYQLRRMAKNTWQRTSPLFKKLQQEVEGRLYEQNPSTGEYKISACFHKLITEAFDLSKYTVIDGRCDTGKKLSLPWVNKPYDLRDYQEEAVELMLANWRGLVNFATGLGKTLVALHLVRRCKRNALIVCPSESVAKQFYEQFVDAFGKTRVGFYGDGKKQIADITIGIAASVSRYVEEFRKQDLGLVIVDEVHHIPATTFFSIAGTLGSVGRLYGLTATDFRSDGKDIMITAGCGNVLICRDILWGVANHWLADPYFIVRKVKTFGHDFKNDKLKAYKEHVLNSQTMCKQIEDDCRKMMAAGKSVLCLVDEVAHGEALSRSLGIPFATGIDSKSSSYVDLLNAGKIPGLVGTDSKVGEGTDTRNVDVLVLGNFAATKGPVIQAIGRGLRKQGSKTRCLILDYIPSGSTMLTRHAWFRVKLYETLSDKVKVI